jgi:hypothetical protein
MLGVILALGLVVSDVEAVSERRPPPLFVDNECWVWYNEIKIRRICI